MENKKYTTFIILGLLFVTVFSVTMFFAGAFEESPRQQKYAPDGKYGGRTLPDHYR